jgi:hypothetical protein
MFRWSARLLSLVVALACVASGRTAAEVPAPSPPPGAGPEAAKRYVAEMGADLVSLESHFQKYRQAAEQLSALYAKLAAKPEMRVEFQPQYLQLQSQMQNENRSYTAVSNIMKTKHDTVKNSISNIR